MSSPANANGMDQTAAPLWTLGINHTTAPLDLRGRFAFALDQLAPALSSLRDALTSRGPSPGPELTLVSTCNRTEIYGAAGGPTQTRQQLEATLDWLAHSGGVQAHALSSHTYTLQGDAAARHAFRVASGLDSMVLGEAQILGQMKDAVRAAEHAGALGTTLHQMFQRSFAVAKEVRTCTDIGTQSISMAAACVKLAAQLFEDLARINVLFVGAGEMIDLAITHFAARSPSKMVIANRTPERGAALAAKYVRAQTMLLAEIPSRLHEFDAVVSCTASTLPIIGLGAVERALKARKHRPIFMVDLAVPRDIEPEVKALDDVYLYTVDDLGALVQQARATRQAAMQQAQAIVDTRVQDFMHWLTHRTEGGITLIQQLGLQTDTWRTLEIARAKKLLAKGQDIDSVLDALSRGLTAKLLHSIYADLNSPRPDQRARARASAEHLLCPKDTHKNHL